MSAQAEQFEFQTEAKQLLDLMIHSVYSHPEIFLRELISNASDAIDKLRFEALSDESLTAFTKEPEIRLEPDGEERRLTVSDTGIGMNRDEIIEYIGTIAKSGSGEFLELLRQRQGEELPPELIGQFGVGFYASFMVADEVELLTRRAGEEGAWLWRSKGDGRYSLEPAERERPGTTITLHLKERGEDEEDFTAEWTLRSIVRKYSDFVEYPIRMRVERSEPETDAEGKPVEGKTKTVVEDETLNSMKAIWLRPEGEVTDEEYNEFYKHISHDWNEPFERILYRAEGTTEFRTLLFIPSKAPFNLFLRDEWEGVQLYVKRVFIMQDCKELIPEYLRFVRGVVDSEDLSLNISREILQQNRQIRVIRNNLEKKILDTLRRIKKNEPERYEAFWGEFGRVLKEGLFQGARDREGLLELCLFQSSAEEEKPTDLAAYVERMAEDQEAIYYLCGKSRGAVEKSPHLEAYRDRGYEVLYLTEPVDEIWTQGLTEYQGKPLRSVGKGEAELADKQDLEARSEQHKDLMEALKGRLEDRVKEVRLSGRLKQSPACLVGETHDMSPQIEAMLRASGQDIPPLKRILELNPAHPMLEKLQALYDANRQDARLDDYAELLYGQSVLAEGGQLPDPAAFSRLVAGLMEQDLGRA